MKLCLKVIFLIAFFITVYGCVNAQKFKEVKIGNQVWMAENLNVFYFRNGDPIPIVKSDEDWVNAGKNKQPACCYLKNSSVNGVKYGLLYNWYALNDARGLAPVGWNLPSDQDWANLFNFLDRDSLSGINLKSQVGWDSYSGETNCKNCKKWSPSIKAGKVCPICKDTRKVKANLSGNGKNDFGFTGLPGGTRTDHPDINLDKRYCFWWSASDYNTEMASAIGLGYIEDFVYKDKFEKWFGFYVRCVKQ